MKRALITALIILVGASLFGSMRRANHRLEIEAAAVRRGVESEAAALEMARSECEEARSQLNAIRLQLRQQPLPDRRAQESVALVSAFSTNAASLTPAQTERLLAELGFSWNTTGPFLVVSKSTLRRVSLAGMGVATPTDAACGVLAITPQERAAVEVVAQGVMRQFQTWTQQHMERTGANGKVLCEYRISLTPEFTSGIQEIFRNAVIGTLGEERGQLFLGYSSDWMSSLGMFGSEPVSLTVEMPAGGPNRRALYTLKTGRSTLTSAITPWQPFPLSFRALFPGGWPDLAVREGFELPPEFNAPTTQ